MSSLLLQNLGLGRGKEGGGGAFKMLREGGFALPCLFVKGRYGVLGAGADHVSRGGKGGTGSIAETAGRRLRVPLHLFGQRAGGGVEGGGGRWRSGEREGQGEGEGRGGKGRRGSGEGEAGGRKRNLCAYSLASAARAAPSHSRFPRFTQLSTCPTLFPHTVHQVTDEPVHPGNCHCNSPWSHTPSPTCPHTLPTLSTTHRPP